jgi:hypothetical protein
LLAVSSGGYPAGSHANASQTRQFLSSPRRVSSQRRRYPSAIRPQGGEMYIGIGTLILIIILLIILL